MTESHTGSAGPGFDLALVREVSAIVLAVVVCLATFRLARSPLLALPVAGLVYWGVRTWILRAAESESSPIESQAERLRELAAGLEALPVGKSRRAEKRSAAPSRLRNMAAELDRLEAELGRQPDQYDEVEFFVESQLPRAVELAERYADLVDKPTLGEREKEALDSAEKTLDLVQSALQELVHRLVARQLHDFEVDRRVLEELLTMERSDSNPRPLSSVSGETT